ncbi:winged helix-turn-helix domain-containing protein [Klebsiella sp. RHBSTW-00484]|uniref:winged helix-turn-helix domain-containing protein n=1 Tax=unclassified Klebsiella TaxID=2608929 RepID=UPI0015E4A6E2|nr:MULTISPECIES: winged helix-turn-helix domain-containing protein [unclassified Klebsiella]MBA7845659.1 winged helix-turn-helix domain-containing protein [Klebsiella sp. RHBSTW-00465]QLO38399.1 winged helix-turn-helix domain-containing protein [Klebsiella sp. RHBSTW-00484]QLT77919.1 winged helix-turn-helix domain-containing protein [Klebsiella sp. RHBSTW-00464]
MNKLYIIEGCIYFDEETMALSINGEQENTLVLPAPSARLLSELIKTNGTMITREELLVRVWEEYGYRASNSNLNNYLSILRRNLTSLLPQTVLITTLPKKGIVFQAQVEENIVSASEEEPISNTGMIEYVETQPEVKPLINWRKITQVIFFIGCGGLAIAAAIWWLPPSSLPVISERYLFTLSQCRFYSVQDTPLSQHEVVSIMDKDNISLNCEGYPRDVFITHYEEPGKRRIMTFFAWCQRAGNGKYTRCENSKTVSWRGA